MTLSPEHHDLLSRTMRRVGSAKKARDTFKNDYIQACSAWRAHTAAGKNLKALHDKWANECAEVQRILCRDPHNLLAWARETARRVAALEVDLAVASVESIVLSVEDKEVLFLKHEKALAEARDALDVILDYKNETERATTQLAVLKKKEPPIEPFDDGSREYQVCQLARTRLYKAQNRLDVLMNEHSEKKARFTGEALEKELVE
jgi:hypothetical protein